MSCKQRIHLTLKTRSFGLVTVATLGATALANAETYTVQKGDTLSAIAKKNGTTVDEIVSKMASKMLIRFILVKN